MYIYNPSGSEVEKAKTLGAWPFSLTYVTNSIPMSESSLNEQVCES